MKEITNTGYNPDYSSFIGTADEKSFYETSAPQDSFASQIKNENLIVEEPFYTAEDIFISEEIPFEEE